MKGHTLIAGLLLAFTTSMIVPAQAQYVTGIGLRGGKFNSGLSIKSFLNANNNVGVEAMIGRSKIGTDYGWIAKGFFIYQRPIMDARMQAPFDLVFGAGLHGAFYKEGYYYLENGHIMPYGYNVYVFGVDAMAGIEYKVPIAPVTITVDCNPFFDLVNKGPEFIDFGLSLRYVWR
jgi:hypothetical protein